MESLAALSITAEDKQRGAGVANPTLTASFSGFVNGDTALATPPSLATTATTSSAAGSYPITVTGGDDPNYTITRIAGTLTISAKEVPVISWSNPSAITFGTALGSTQLNATASTEGTFSYDPASGIVLDAGNSQTLTVTFTPTNSAAFASASKTVTINVNKATPTITWSNPAAVTYGTALSAQLNAATSAPGTISYTPANGVLNAGTHVLTATLAEGDNHAAASKTVNLTVNPAALTITADNKQRGAGLANPTLTASYSGLVNGDTAPATPPSLTTTATTGSAAGTYPITVTGGADPNYTITRVHGTLTVSSKEVPVITWSNPTAITYGAALASTQLNATASTAGSFTYTPPIGTALAAGSYTLSASFEPANTTQFATATKTVTLTVTPKALTIAARNATRKEGESNPVFAANYTGLANGDTAPASPPVLSTIATADSPAGTYPITVAGGADPNYTITRGNGTLTVTEGDPVEPTEAPLLSITKRGNRMQVAWKRTEGWILTESDTIRGWVPTDERAIEEEDDVFIFEWNVQSGTQRYFRLERQ